MRTQKASSMRRVRALVCLVGLLAAFAVGARAAPGDCDSPSDASNDYKTPTPSDPAAACTGMLTAGTDTEDWFGFTLLVGDVLVAGTAGPSQGGAPGALPSLEVRGPAPDYAIQPCQQTTACQIQATKAGTFAVGVKIASGSDGARYALTVAVGSLKPPPPPPPPPPPSAPSAPLDPCEPNDAQNKPTDAGESADRATPAPAWTPQQNEILCTGRFDVSETDSADWYTFRAHSTTGSLQVVVQPPNNFDVAVELRNTGGQVIAPRFNGGTSQPHVFLETLSAGSATTPTSKGLWRVGIFPGRGPKTTSYTLAVSIEEV